MVVRHAARRAGLPAFGPHRLRHRAATATLRAGAPLGEVAQLLRHRTLAVTASYARADPGALRELARPWPGGGA
jgi:integrase